MQHKIQILSLLTLTVLNSCAVLYNPPAQPTPFLKVIDGTAVNGNIGFHGSTVNINANVTKPISDVLSVNASVSKSIAGIYNEPYNPYKSKNSKQDFNINAHIGYNITQYTKFPIQLWFGINYGISKNSSLIYPGDVSISKDVMVNNSGNIYDSIFKYEYLKGYYLGTRFGATAVLLSNYDNNQKIKNRKKYFFDIIGTAHFSPTRYYYANAINISSNKNNIFGLASSIRVGSKNWILHINNDNMFGFKVLTDELVGKINTTPNFDYIPVSTVSIGFTKLMH
jgi:hypothetical protein